MKQGIVALCLLTLALPVPAQTQEPWQTYYEQVGTLDDVESASWEETYNLLNELAADKINLNTATRDDLERLPFLSAQQIEDIMAYLYRYAPLQSTGELAMIESLDATQRRLLACFVEVSPPRQAVFPTWKNIAHYGKHELVASAHIPFYKRKGDREGYQGDPLKHWLRYTFHYGTALQAAVIGAKDAGEPFFRQGNAGYDYYSAYVLLRTHGWLKSLVAGRYRLRFGMGLVLNNDYGFGKMGTLATLGRNTDHLSGHASRSTGNYLQGAAATLALNRHLDFTTFFSYRDIDATLSADSSGIATVLTSGYHRTPGELARKNNASQWAAGGRVRWAAHGFHVGASGVATGFDKPLSPAGNQLYRYWYARGQHFYNLGIDYGYQGSRLFVSGETALDRHQAVATVNTVSYRLHAKLTLIALQRFYAYRFNSLFAESFSEGGRVQNESGIYVGIDWRPTKYLSLLGYADYASMPWARYQVSQASHACDYLAQAVYTRKRITLQARYRLHRRPYDNDDKTALVWQNEHRARLSATYAADHWQWGAQARWVHTGREHTGRGGLLAARGGYRSDAFRVSAQVACFHTDDFRSRIYLHEGGLLYNFSFPSFYGRGLRYVFNAQARLSAHVQLIAHVGITDYTDRTHIASGLQQIDSSAQTDLDIQMRWKF